VIIGKVTIHKVCLEAIHGGMQKASGRISKGRK
jgi:hypothetical protein